MGNCVRYPKGTAEESPSAGPRPTSPPTQRPAVPAGQESRRPPAQRPAVPAGQESRRPPAQRPAVPAGQESRRPPEQRPAVPAGQESREQPAQLFPAQAVLGRPRHIPTPRNRPHRYTAQNLENAFTQMAAHLRRHNHNITIVAIGGVWNVLKGMNRPKTYDFNYLGENFTTEQGQWLRDAAAAAAAAAGQMTPRMGEDWFAPAQVSVPGRQNQVLGDALEEDNRLFGSVQRGLRVVYAPLKYAFCAKVEMISYFSTREAPTYHYEDAACYLHALSQSLRLSRREILRWYAHYHLPHSHVRSIIDRVVEMYHKNYNLEIPTYDP
jgi:hypothetical protein